MSIPIRNQDESVVLARLRTLLNRQLNDPHEALIIVEKRPIGGAVEENSDVRDIVFGAHLSDEFIFKASDLIEIPRSTAVRIAEELFYRGVMGAFPRSKAEARVDASDFLFLFGDDARFFSTMEHTFHDRGRRARGRCMLPHTLEDGFFVVDSTHVGCLILGDED